MIRNIRTTASGVLVFLTLFYTASGQPPTGNSGKTAVIDAVFGESVRRDCKIGDADIYLFRLEAGTSVRIDMGKHNVWLEMTSYAADPSKSGGASLGRVDVDHFSASIVEPLVVSAETAGTYALRIAVSKGPPGYYTVNFGRPHVTSDIDRAYADAAAVQAEIHSSSLPNITPRVPELLQKKAGIFRRIGDDGSEGLVHLDLGRFYYISSEMEAAIDSWRRSAELFGQAKAFLNMNSSRFKVAEAMEERGDYEEAIRIAEEGLETSRREAMVDHQLHFLNTLGVYHHRLGDEAVARYYYEKGLALAESLGPTGLSKIALPLRNLSNLLRAMNGGEVPIEFFPTPTQKDREQALGFMLKVLEIDQQTKVPNYYTLRQLGNIYGELGDYTLAEQYLHKAAAGYLSVGERGNAARAYMSLANLYVEKGEPAIATEILDREIPILESIEPELPDYIAKIYVRAGQSGKALAMLDRSIAVSRKRQHLPAVASSLFHIAVIEREQGNFKIARESIEEAIEMSESVRNQIVGDELRRRYFSSVKRFYDFYVDLLMQAAKSQPDLRLDKLALTMSEKGRSRSMLDLLGRSRVDIHEGVDPILLQGQHKLKQALSNKAAQRNRLLISKLSDEKVAKVNKEVAELSIALDENESSIRKSSPRYASLTRPRSLTSDEIMELVGDGTVLLEYHLGEKKSYLWAISRIGITSFDLPARNIIEEQARKVYDSLSRKGEAPASNAARRMTDAKAIQQEDALSLRSLAQTLIGPAAQTIKNKRLVIVPDGVLNYVPFAALPGNAGSYRPLAEDHEIVTLPSASVLAVLRSESAPRPEWANSIAVFADPVFERSDSRTKAPKQFKLATEVSSSPKPFDLAVRDVGLSGGLGRLPFSRREAKAITRAAPSGSTLIKTDFDANKASVFASGLDKFRILHFATHGLLDSQHPELSGVVLSLVDKDGQPTDGFLRLQDIYSLKLNADLVVLSACNTALGKEVRGEGLIGMTRGFMYAGAPRVVASLWKVDDAATAELMSIFYRRMLHDQLRPAAALRAAQLELSKQPRWRSPYYWAPFLLQGEWK